MGSPRVESFESLRAVHFRVVIEAGKDDRFAGRSSGNHLIILPVGVDLHKESLTVPARLCMEDLDLIL